MARPPTVMIRRSPDLKSSTGATTTFIALPPRGSGRMAHTCPTGEYAIAGLGSAGPSVFACVTAWRLRHHRGTVALPLAAARPRAATRQGREPVQVVSG